jgi:hypothetical protein
VLRGGPRPALETAKLAIDQGRAAAIDRELTGPIASATKLLRSYYPR